MCVRGARCSAGWPPLSSSLPVNGSGGPGGGIASRWPYLFLGSLTHARGEIIHFLVCRLTPAIACATASNSYWSSSRLCMSMCADMCADMFGDTGAGMCAGMCAGMRVGMRSTHAADGWGSRGGMCIDMCIHMRGDMYAGDMHAGRHARGAQTRARTCRHQSALRGRLGT